MAPSRDVKAISKYTSHPISIHIIHNLLLSDRLYDCQYKASKLLDPIRSKNCPKTGTLKLKKMKTIKQIIETDNLNIKGEVLLRGQSSAGRDRVGPMSGDRSL